MNEHTDLVKKGREKKKHGKTIKHVIDVVE